MTSMPGPQPGQGPAVPNPYQAGAAAPPPAPYATPGGDPFAAPQGQMPMAPPMGQYAPPPKPAPRNKPLRWIALAAALVLTVVAGVLGYQLFGSIDVTKDLDAAATTASIIKAIPFLAVAGLLVLVLAIVAVVKCRPKGIAVTALVLSIILPGLAFLGGFVGGTVSLANQASNYDLSNNRLADLVRDSLAEHGVNNFNMEINVN